MKRLGVLALWVFVSIIPLPAHAALEISVSTDKPTYYVGETVEVYVSVYNSYAYPATLTFPNSIEATYLMDDSYYWHSTLSHLPMVSQKILPPGQTLTWQLDHDAYHQSQYPLSVGYHSVQGACMAIEMFGQHSQPATFEVIPEPATLSLIATGAVLVRRRRRIKRPPLSTILEILSSLEV